MYAPPRFKLLRPALITRRTLWLAGAGAGPDGATAGAGFQRKPGRMLNLTCFPAGRSVPLGLITPCLHSLSFTPQYLPPPSPPSPPWSQSFSHLLPLLYRLIKTLLNPAAASSLRFRSSRDTVRDHLCVCVRCLPPSCVCVSVDFDTTECLDIFYIYISLLGMLVFCLHQQCVSAVYVSLEHVS